jgi:hypothetical protein
MPLHHGVIRITATSQAFLIDFNLGSRIVCPQLRPIGSTSRNVAGAGASGGLRRPFDVRFKHGIPTYPKQFLNWPDATLVRCADIGMLA